ncbi:MAG: hypothetical protein HY569_01425 [Candidatus Magasanikbacteria bacterium]|nr:hypothetical protein [Candidatus Magasanikbacteria bacterium]
MKKFLFIGIIGIIAVALGISGWYFILRKDNGQPPVGAGLDLPTAQTKEEPEIDAGTIELLKKFADDQDRDGIKDADEKAKGLNPNEFDSDFDGLSDKLEIEKWKTDPLKKDTDGDGFGDGNEIIHGYNPLGAGKLNQ